MTVKNFTKFIVLFSLLVFPLEEVSAQITPLMLARKQDTARDIRQWLWRQTDNGDIFPFLRATHDKVEFLNVNYQVIASYDYLPLSKVRFSPSNQVVAFIERLSDESAIENRKFIYHIVRFDGKEMFSLPVTCVSDEPYPEIYVSDQGDALLVDGAKGEVKIFRGQVEPEKVIDLFLDDIYNFEKPIDVAISRNGKYFSVVAQKQPSFFSEEGLEYISGKPYLFLFSMAGKEQWRRALVSDNGASTAISPSGYYIIASHYSSKIDGAAEFRTTIFYANGKKILELPMKFRLCRFSRDEVTLFLADNRDLYRIDLLSKEYTCYHIISSEQERLIVDFALQRGTEPVILTGKTIFAKDHFEYSELEILQLSNYQFTTFTLDSENDAMIFPSIFATKNNIAIGLKNTIKIFRDRRE